MRFSVMLDPGHGGSDPGRVVGTAKEADIALRVSKYLANELAEREVLVSMTRWADVDMAIGARASLANTFRSNVFVSVHCNANINPDVRGPQSLFAKGSVRGRSLADTTQEALETVVDASKWSGALSDGSVHTGYTKAAKAYADGLSKDLSWANRDRLTRMKFGEDTYRTLGVLRQTNMPAVLLELGFLTNPEDRAILTNASLQRAVATAIADALLDWLDRDAGVT